jgi:hypothetical protein
MVAGSQCTKTANGFELRSEVQPLVPALFTIVAVAPSTRLTFEADGRHPPAVRVIVNVSGAEPLRVKGGENLATPLSVAQVTLPLAMPLVGLELPQSVAITVNPTSQILLSP